MLMVALVLVNILIAIFSEAWQLVNENKGLVSARSLADLIIEESYDLPFSVFNPLVQLFLIIYCIITTPIGMFRSIDYGQ